MKDFFPVLRACNYDSRRDSVGMYVLKALLAVTQGFTRDTALLFALDALEKVRTDYKKGDGQKAAKLADDAELTVVSAWLRVVSHANEIYRIAQQRD